MEYSVARFMTYACDTCDIWGKHMKIGFFMPRHSIWGPALDSLAQELPGHRILAGLGPSSPDVSDLDILVAGRLPRGTYLASPALKAIFQPFTGVNHLPADELLARGVEVFNVHSNAFDVAERALALTLAFYGRVVDYHEGMRKGLWHGFWVGAGSEDNWDSLYGKSCAILGTGAIGVALAGLLKAFSCTVVGWRRSSGKDIPAGFDAVAPTLEKAIAKAEIVFVALPGTPATEGLLSRDILMRMKGKFLVNVGRGSIVDEEGLYLALKEGILKGAAIDTWYRYPAEGKFGFPSTFPIHELPNVILSPHVGGATNQSSARAVEATMANLRSYLATGRCANKIDLRALY